MDILSPMRVDGAANTGTLGVSAAATTSLDCRRANVFRVAMGASITTLNLDYAADGQTINIRFTQDGTGGRTVTWPASFKWQGGAAVALSTAANAVDMLVATFFADTGHFIVSLLRGAA